MTDRFSPQSRQMSYVQVQIKSKMPIGNAVIQMQALCDLDATSVRDCVKGWWRADATLLQYHQRSAQCLWTQKEKLSESSHLRYQYVINPIIDRI